MIPTICYTVLVPSPDLVGIRLRKTDLCKLSLDAGLPGALVSSEQAHTCQPPMLYSNPCSQVGRADATLVRQVFTFSPQLTWQIPASFIL